MSRRRNRAQARPPRSRAAAVAVLPRRKPSPRLSAIAPSGRSIAVGLGIFALAFGGYAAARQSSAFAVTAVDVSGVDAALARQVRRAAAPYRGTSLLALDGSALVRRVEALPAVVAARYDRAFPHTLRLEVVPEKDVAVLHRGRETWLVSARGRVVQRVPRRAHGPLAQIWVPRRTPVEAGAFLPADRGGTLARSLALASRFPARIGVATLRGEQLVFRLRSGLELRLGEPTDVRLKLAIARRALRQLPAGATYVDVSVPTRPVAGTDNPQLSG